MKKERVGRQNHRDLLERVAVVRPADSIARVGATAHWSPCHDVISSSPWTAFSLLHTFLTAFSLLQTLRFLPSSGITVGAT